MLNNIKYYQIELTVFLKIIIVVYLILGIKLFQGVTIMSDFDKKLFKILIQK